MTPTKYFLARIGLAFGIQRRNLRMADAAGESHLLRDAELHLGLALWEKCEHLEEISVEYWNTRKIVKELAEKEKQLIENQAKLDAAHEERSSIILSATEADPAFVEERTALLHELDALAFRRDEIVVKARNLRRVYDGLKTKLEVLTEPGTTAKSEDIETCKEKLRKTKIEFDELKAQRDTIAQEITEKDAKVVELDRNQKELGSGRRAEISEAFQTIGEYNQEVAALRAEIGLMQKRHLELCTEIGRYLSRNIKTSPECAAICKTHRGLISIMAALRRSITFNHRIAGL